LRSQAFVNGEWINAAQNATHDVHNPATGEKLGTVPDMGAAETRHAIEAAAGAFPAWARLTAKERGTILRRWYDLMMANQEDLALIMTAEQGKPLAESKGEIAYGRARSHTLRPSSIGLPKKASACTATSFQPIRRTSGCSCCVSRSAWSPRSPPGIFPRP
jgi:hypothetical protein